MLQLFFAKIFILNHLLAHRLYKRDTYNPSPQSNHIRSSCANNCGNPLPIVENPNEFTTICSCHSSCGDKTLAKSPGRDQFNNFCCTDYFEKCDIENENYPGPWKEQECSYLKKNEGSCPSGFYNEETGEFEQRIILISLDGFRMGYMEREEFVQHLGKLRNCGIHVPYQRSSYPTVTFPNHYSIVTGLYTESHGIVDNSFQSPTEATDQYGRTGDYFNAFDSVHSNQKWWGGEPIWQTVKNQGKISATYMWPGSDKHVNNQDPNVYFNFSGSAPYEHRVQTVLSWLDGVGEQSDSIDNKIPNFMNLYFDEPDHAGHNEGLDQYEIFNPVLKSMDNIIKMLFDGLAARNLLGCVNVIIGADHGMALNNAKERRTFVGTQSGDDDYCYNYKRENATTSGNLGAYCYTGTQSRIGPALGHVEDFDVENEWPKFACTRQNPEDSRAHWWAYRKELDMPRRLHYTKTERIENILMMMEDEWYSSKSTTNTYSLVGNHGYDNNFESMRALFVAQGPAFRDNVNTSYVHQNIELYQMMSHILGVEPAPNNATSGSMNHILSTKNQLPVNPLPVFSDIKSHDTENMHNNWDESCSNCVVNNDKEILSIDNQKILNGLNLPMVQSQEYDENADQVRFMNYYDYTTLVDTKSGKILATAFTVQQEINNSESTEVSSCLRNDPRIPTKDSNLGSSCENYQEKNQQLFFIPPIFSKDSNFINNLITTQKIENPDFPKFWTTLTEDYVKIWSENGPVEVVTGPIFDLDFNGEKDDFIVPESDPTQFYFVMKRMNEKNDDQETMAFIIPNYSKNFTCNWDVDRTVDENYVSLLKIHYATLRDIEYLTGLSFEEFVYGEGVSDQAIHSRLFLNELDGFWDEDKISGLEPIDPTDPTDPTTDAPTSSNIFNYSIIALVLTLLL